MNKKSLKHLKISIQQINNKSDKTKKLNSINNKKWKNFINFEFYILKRFKLNKLIFLNNFFKYILFQIFVYSIHFIKFLYSHFPKILSGFLFFNFLLCLYINGPSLLLYLPSLILYFLSYNSFYFLWYCFIFFLL